MSAMEENFVDFMSKGDFRRNPYHYIPTRGVAITFIVLFSISTIIHAAQAVKYRMWWLLPTAGLCGVLEILGWSARLWSSFNPSLADPFEIQITATILGPTPLLAANFVILGIIIQWLGEQYSRLSPKQYMIVFCTFDVISLVIQGVGGGKAAVAAGNGRNPTPGGHIMLGGIAFQLFTITVYGFCAAEFFLRYSHDRPFVRPNNNSTKASEDVKQPMKSQGIPEARAMSTKVLVMSLALLMGTTFLFIRAVYRTVELSDGWAGRIISTQRFFNILDGGMIVIAIYTLNIAHPGLLLGSGLSFTNAGIAKGSQNTSPRDSEDAHATDNSQ